jgi:hypothetical protein
MILAKKIGEMHKPNKYYLEYVPEDILKEAIAHLTHTRYKSLFPTAPATTSTAASKRSRPLYLSHFASTQMLASWVSSVLFPPA